MVARGNFGHHTAVGCVLFDLTVKRMRQQAIIAVIDRHPGLIAGGFYSEYFHSYGSIDGLGVKNAPFDVIAGETSPVQVLNQRKTNGKSVDYLLVACKPLYLTGYASGFPEHLVL